MLFDRSWMVTYALFGEVLLILILFKCLLQYIRQQLAATEVTLEVLMALLGIPFSVLRLWLYMSHYLKFKRLWPSYLTLATLRE